MNDFEARLAARFSEQVEHELDHHGVATTPPARPAARTLRRTGWLSLLTAASVVAVAAGTYGATQLLASPAPPARPVPVTPNVTTTGPTTSASASTASSPTSTPPASRRASSAPTTPHASSTHPRGATSTAPRTSAVASRSQAAAASTPGRCGAGQLAVTIDSRHIPGNGTDDGTVRQVHARLIDFQNISGQTCTLRGYPRVALVRYDGTRSRLAVPTTADPYGGTSPITVTLRPYEFAAAYVVGLHQKAPGNCGETSPRIEMTPPDTTQATTLPDAWSVCYQLHVHPVQALRDPP